MKKNLPIFLSIIIVILILSLIISNISYKSDISGLKKEVLKKDSLVKIREGEYSKLVDDTKSNRDLKNELKDLSKDTYSDVKKNKEDVISISDISFKPESKIIYDTIYLDPKSNDIMFSSYYPNKDSTFVKYSATISQGSVKSDWQFYPLKVSLVITQQKDGMFKSRFIGPKWIEVDKLTVNSLPMDKIKERNLKFLIGGAGGFDFDKNDFSVGVYTGLRYKSNIILLNGNSNKNVSIGYIKEF